MSKPQVRHALPDDHPTMTDALVEAFADDPFMAWLFPGTDDRAEPTALRALMQADVEVHQHHGHSYVLDGGCGAALWAPPGAQVDHDKVGAVISEFSTAERATKVSETFLSMMEYLPTTPFFYLAVIGVRDDCRGAGLGEQLLSRLLDVCDREGLTAHLESSNPRNVTFYERHGFSVLGEVACDPGVVLRPMARPPA